MPPHKRQKLSPLEGSDASDAADASSISESSEDEFSAGELESSQDESDQDDIEGLSRQKSKQTSKRKLRATGSTKFGATLEGLLRTEAPAAPLSLKPSIARKRNDEKLEQKAKKVLQQEKKEKEDKARVRDVIGGWGGESERALRKVAQRGVVRLFNIIQQSQTSAAAAEEDIKASRGTGKPTLPAPKLEGKGKKKKDNIIGRGKEPTVEKDDFFNLIKTGGVVSKS